ncbi:hypothetical protein HPSH_05295 [Helicobacter pylori Shi470]|nr:hypothetical protein HPSH_05295 [Helicobacter pylori Shi470]
MYDEGNVIAEGDEIDEYLANLDNEEGVEN